MNKKQYDLAGEKEKAKYVQDRYDRLPGGELYITSPDFNLRELEIDFIIESIRHHCIAPPRILDIGCGNGYTDIQIAQEMVCKIVGMDFSQKMIDGAKELSRKFGLHGEIDFRTGDCSEDFPFPDDHFDVVISERLIHNLPTWEIQKKALREVHRVLKRPGIYVMVEGTYDGLKRLNDARERVGLEPIPNRKKSNIMSLKLRDDETEEYLSDYFLLVKRHDFGMYYLISRVIHPLLVAPEQPTFDAEINKVAREIASEFPSYRNLGHVRGMVLRKL